MPRQLEQLIQGYEPWQLAIELAIIWGCVYVIFRFLQGTRGAGVVKGFLLLLVIATITIRVLAGASDAFTRLNFIYDKILGLVAILLIVVFQPELRQALVRLGRAWSFRTSKSSLATVIDAVSDAVTFLSKNQFGALIAIERTGRLGGLVESGAQIDAVVDARLLESIFWPSNPLHDLGVVIRDERIVAASVQFPLAEEGVLPVGVGSRHRAAAGLSQESDCLVVIVSEETGAISFAEHGRLDRDIPRDEFRDILAQRLRAPVPEETETEEETPAEKPMEIETTTTNEAESPDDQRAA
ncbi:MAG: TIGR00159 family protein [Planctomycetes bacterium]|nr:TIGR00159 family protein [Planctomycetota bacterium]